jgi:hypothetical protein
MAPLFSDDVEASAITVERAIESGTHRRHPVAAHMLGKAMSPSMVRPGHTFTEHPHQA